MVNNARIGHSDPMKTTEDTCKCTVEETALKNRMEAKSREFVKKGVEDYAKA